VGSGVLVLYIGRTVPKGLRTVSPYALRYCSRLCCNWTSMYVSRRRSCIVTVYGPQQNLPHWTVINKSVTAKEQKLYFMMCRKWPPHWRVHAFILFFNFDATRWRLVSLKCTAANFFECGLFLYTFSFRALNIGTRRFRSGDRGGHDLRWALR
jgi:hypothetical protein